MTVSTKAWKPIAEGHVVEIQDIAFRVFARYRSRDEILRIVTIAAGQTMLPRPIAWTPYSIATGDAAVALAFGYAHSIEPLSGWDRVAHTYLSAGFAEISQIDKPGIVGGLTGLNFALGYLSADGKRYRRAQQKLDQLLNNLLVTSTFPLPTKLGISVSVYDQISGISGIGRYLLNQKRDSMLRPHLDYILEWLIRRAQIADMQGFHTSAEAVPEYEKEASPHLAHGFINCGLAHGIPGPLALLAIAKLHGYQHPELAKAIRKLADWLVEKHYEDPYGRNWPTHDVEGRRASDVTRTAWCYGLPGVVRALYLAAESLADEGLREFAADALLKVEQRPLHIRRIDSPTFCHGIAGLLQIVLRFAHDTRDDAFRRFGNALIAQLVEAYDEASSLGFQDIEPKGNKVDSPSLLTGGLSPALALLAASSDHPPDWDQAFLLS